MRFVVEEKSSVLHWQRIYDVLKLMSDTRVFSLSLLKWYSQDRSIPQCGEESPENTLFSPA